jgi:hypothetical protein
VSLILSYYQELNRAPDMEGAVAVGSKEVFPAEENYTPLSPEDVKIDADSDLDSSSTIK